MRWCQGVAVVVHTPLYTKLAMVTSPMPQKYAEDWS